MTKLLQNKSLIKFLAIALSVLLIVALIPQISIAYGSKDDVVSEDNPIVETDAGEEAALADTGEELEAEGEQPADEADDPAEGEGEEAPDPATNEPAPQADEGVAAVIDEPTQPAKAARAAATTTEALTNSANHTIDGDITNSKGTLEYSIPGQTRTLKVNGTLHSNILVTGAGGKLNLEVSKGGILNGDIRVTGGAKLVVVGAGTIQGTGNGSVISVEGSGTQNTRLVFGEVSGTAPKVTGGKGTVHEAQENKRVGGGIRVIRTDKSGSKAASFLMRHGTIEGNEAQAGGGIYVDSGCGFTMDGGTVEGNTATDSEGGGIFVWSNKDASFGDYVKINAGKIINNKTENEFSWGGGGLFVNSGAAVHVNSAQITGNTAHGLGGGVAGCPHASIAVTTVANGAAIYQNDAQGTSFPTNPRLRLLDTNSVIEGNENKVVATGDFLFDGLQEVEGLGTAGADGRWSGSGASKGSTSVFAKYGNYAKSDNLSQYAQDFYCTRASYIAPTSLGDESGVAWVGFEAGIPAVAKNATVSADNMETRLVQISTVDSAGDNAAVTQYASVDATLGLTSKATKDDFAGAREVEISGNVSYTHGGGVASNGALEFGTFDWENESFAQSYSVVLQKEIVNSLKNQIGKKEDGTYSFTEDERFTFTLTDKDTKETYKATSDENGVITFVGIPGFTANDFSGGKTTVEKTKQFTLTEESNALYDTIKEVTVDVKLQGKKETTKFITSAQVMHSSTVYETEVESVTVGQQNNNIVTNTLQLKGEETLQIQKNTVGIGGGSFDFQVQEVNVPEESAVSDDEVVLPDGATVESLTKAGNPSSLKVENIKEEDGKGSGTTESKLSYTEPGTHWYLISETSGDKTTDSGTEVDYDKTVYLVRVGVTESNDHRSLETVKTTWKASDASASKLAKVESAENVSFTNVAMKYAGFELGLTKRILTTLGDNLDLDNRTFTFSLFDGDKVVVEDAVTDATTGKLTLALTDPAYAKAAYEAGENGTTFTFTLEEAPEAEGSFMSTIEKAEVLVELKASGERKTVDDHEVFLVTPTVETVTVNGTDVTAEADKSITVTNRYTPNGTWQFTADKFFYGDQPNNCSFTMVELEAAPAADQPLAEVAVKQGDPWTAKVNATDFDQDGKAAITFPAVPYKAEGTGEGKQNDVGDHFYLITEDGDASAKDTTAYVVQVSVAVSETNPGELVTTETVLGYADDVNQPLQTLTDATERPSFYNTDTFGLISAANFSVYAASGEPVDQVCYVDPKIYKNLEGRAIKSGEFAFKLIEVANYDDTEGTVISATTNDEFGMVDFDKANNVSGDLENPSCLAYTKPGTYYYRVVEDTSKGGMNDQSVLYSDQVITFTTVIEQNEQTGQLECTDMYYGYWDKAAGKNVRFDEQYVDYDTTPANIGDMAKLNPDWHPTITNKTRPMDLQVRKTSVTDRNEGLVGATYALYMVNENAQGDIKLAEATSEEGGWITYKNVSLSTNNLYYFKETAAPAGHTVSEFRSAYFSLVEDAASDNGYTLQYRDTKAAAETSADAALLADDVIEADMKNAAAEDTAADGDEQAQATDEETQLGYSADGNVLLTYNKDGGVADEATELSVSKLDTRTHEWVEGADLVILEKDSGKEIASWTSGKAPQKLEKTLNVGTTYLLREVNAPENYKLANDVEFVIDSYGNVSITKGTENGNAELSDNTINLYDTMMDAEEVDTQNREKVREVPEAGSLLAKTGDMLPLLGIGVVALAALIALLVAVRRRRANEKDSAQS